MFRIAFALHGDEKKALMRRNVYGKGNWTRDSTELRLVPREYDINIENQRWTNDKRLRTINVPKRKLPENLSDLNNLYFAKHQWETIDEHVMMMVI